MALLGRDSQPVDLVQCAAYQLQGFSGIQQGQIVNPCLDGRGAGVEGESAGFLPARKV